MKFSDTLVGQNRIRHSVENAWQNGKLSHAYLICGKDGMGKRHVASEIVKLIGMNENNPDYAYVTNEDKDKQGKPAGIETLRNRVVHDIMIKPAFSKYKVYVIDKVDMMRAEAQNCLLKTLEEPPAYAIIILLAEKPDGVIATIRSRVTLLELENYSDEQLMEIAANRGVNAANALKAIELCGGNPGKMIKLSEDDDFLTLANEVEARCKRLNGNSENVISFLQYVEEYKDAKNREKLMNIFDFCVITFHKLCVEASKCGKMNQVRFYVRTLELVEEKRDLVLRNVNAGLCIQDLFMRIQEEADKWLK